AREDLLSYLGHFPHHLAVFLTYTFEDQVYRKLREYTQARVIILHDVEHGKTAESLDSSTALVRPVVIRTGVRPMFHAKLVLLGGESRAALAFGSMNLTVDSLASSKLETAVWFEVPRASSVLGDVVRFLDALPISRAEKVRQVLREIP